MLAHIMALGLAFSLAFNVVAYTRAAQNAETLAHCTNGGSFAAHGRVINCFVDKGE